MLRQKGKNFTLRQHSTVKCVVSHFGPCGFFKYESQCAIKFIFGQLSIKIAFVLGLYEHQGYVMYVIQAVFCMTVRICMSIPYIGPAIIAMFFSNFLSHELCDWILRKNEAKDTQFLFDHKEDLRKQFLKRYHSKALKFQFDPNFGGICDMSPPLFAIFYGK